MALNVRALIKKAIPAPLLAAYGRMRLKIERNRNARQDARSVFEKIYADNLWGGRAGEFNSGSGSDAGPRLYAETVTGFMRERGLTRVVDLGCGDFRVGRNIALPEFVYTGVDVVGPLIERNQREFGRAGVSFLRLDIASDPLPAGDVVLIRQVLQHLSNAQVRSIVDKALDQYAYVIVSEHLPAPGPWVRPNKDKPHGPDTRLCDDSGLFLDQAPFNYVVDAVLLKVDVPDSEQRPGEQIVTSLLKGNGSLASSVR